MLPPWLSAESRIIAIADRYGNIPINRETELWLAWIAVESVEKQEFAALLAGASSEY